MQIPKYLINTYSWAYINPKSIRFFETKWLINLILWGQYNKLKDIVIQKTLNTKPKYILQSACAYGSLSTDLLNIIPPDTNIDIFDVVPQQIKNLEYKISNNCINKTNYDLFLHNAENILRKNFYDLNILFFLLHEVPDESKNKIILSAYNNLKSNGKLIIVDYHKANKFHPCNPIMYLVFKYLEPFANTLIKNDLLDRIINLVNPKSIKKTTYFGNLYQVLEIIKN